MLDVLGVGIVAERVVVCASAALRDIALIARAAHHGTPVGNGSQYRGHDLHDNAHAYADYGIRRVFDAIGIGYEREYHRSRDDGKRAAYRQNLYEYV